MSLVRAQPTKAIECYQKAAAAQQQYRNLHHVSFWEMAIANLALWDIQQSLECWTILRAEATVSLSRSHTRKPAHVTAVVESDLRVWYGNLYVASLQGREKGGDPQALRRGFKVETADSG